MAARRVPRRRPVLRDLGLPDHDAAPRRAAVDRDDLAARTSCPAGHAACCPRSRSCCVVTLLGWPRSSGATRSPRSERGRRRRPCTSSELVADLPRPELLRGDRPPVAAAASVVARDRGAVLPALAAGRARDRVVARQERARRHRRGRHGRRGRVGRVDGRARRARERAVRRRRVAHLLRHRHPRVGAAARLRRGRRDRDARPRPADRPEPAQPSRATSSAWPRSPRSSGCCSRRASSMPGCTAAGSWRWRRSASSSWSP